MVEILAALSASAAGGLRIALPLLVIGLVQRGDLWSRVPLLAKVPPPLLLGILVSWSLTELVFSKDRIGQRLLQGVEVVCSPVVGAILGIAVAQMTGLVGWQIWVVGIVGGLLALVIQLVQTGWFYRLRQVPFWGILAADGLCVLLVLFAFDAPQQGGIIALLLLWIAIRSGTSWRQWYLNQPRYRSPGGSGTPGEQRSQNDPRLPRY